MNFSIHFWMRQESKFIHIGLNCTYGGTHFKVRWETQVKGHHTQGARHTTWSSTLVYKNNSKWGKIVTCFIKFCPSLSIPRQTFLTTGISTLLLEHSVLWWMAIHDSQMSQYTFHYFLSQNLSCGKQLIYVYTNHMRDTDISLGKKINFRLFAC